MAALKQPGFLSRLAKVECSYGALPHWEHPGVAAFVTFRLGDSLPHEKVGPLMERMKELQGELREARSIRDSRSESHPCCGRSDVCVGDSRSESHPCDGALVDESRGRVLGAGVAPRRPVVGGAVAPRLRDESEILHDIKSLRADFEGWLDAGYGSCLFADAANRLVVEDAIRYYDGKRYSLYAYVVMPNHVHVLFMPNDGETIQSLIRDLKHFVSVKLSERKTWNGSFWQSEYWDTLVRDAAHFDRVRAYIRGNNPQIAYDAYAGV